jgi:hypothetical protein
MRSKAHYSILRNSTQVFLCTHHCTHTHSYGDDAVMRLAPHHCTCHCWELSSVCSSLCSMKVKQLVIIVLIVVLIIVLNSLYSSLYSSLCCTLSYGDEAVMRLAHRYCTCTQHWTQDSTQRCAQLRRRRGDPPCSSLCSSLYSSSLYSPLYSTLYSTLYSSLYSL